VPGRASMLAVPPSAGLLSCARPGQVAAQLAPFGHSDMLAIPLLSARGKPDPPCAPATPTRRPSSHRIGSCHPAGGTHQPRSGGMPTPTNLHSDGTPQPAAVACHERGEKGLGRHLAGRLVGAEERREEVGTRSVLRELTRRGCLSGAGKACATSSPSPLPREHRKAVPRSGTTNNEARPDAGPALAPRCNEKARRQSQAQRYERRTGMNCAADNIASTRAKGTVDT
jgi:hypothetical protein